MCRCFEAVYNEDQSRDPYVINGLLIHLKETFVRPHSFLKK